MPIASDFSVAANGDVRYTGTGTNYTVVALHRYLQDLADNASASGDDLLDITDTTPSDRSTDNIVTLLSPYNIDDTAAQHLYDGSIIQTNGDVIYDGFVVYANTGAFVEMIQNGAPVSPNFWTTGLNGDSTQGISHRFMLKVRTAAADIDGRRLIGQTREMGETFSEFKVAGTSRGNNTVALVYATDLNNSTAASTIATWTNVTNTEGYANLDVDNNAVNEHYYSDWTRATRTINQFYERLKWLSRRATADASGTDTGTDYAVGDGTTDGQGESFAAGSNNQYLMRVHAHLKKNGSPTGNLVAKVYAHTGTFGSSGTPTGSALATSVNLDVSKLTTSYLEYEIAFATPYFMTASTNYFVTFEYSGGDASNYVKVEGAASGTAAGNRASHAGSWTASSGSDLWFQVYMSPKLYGLPGEVFRGITHEITVDTPTGTFSAVEAVSWSGGTGQMLAINSPTAATKMWIQLLTGVIPTDNQVITGATSGATVQMNVTIVERTLSQPFVGASTGSALIGAYGLGILPTDLTSLDKVFDLTNAQVSPPNFVTFTVNGLVSSEDYILVGPETGGTFQENQLALSGAYSGGEATVTVTSAIPTDTPATGSFRVQDNTDGRYVKVTYTGYSGSSFTGCSGMPAASNGANAWISYIDKLATASTASFTGVFLSTRSLFVRDRDGGGTPIKTFESTASLGSAGGSVTIIRTPDA